MSQRARRGNPAEKAFESLVAVITTPKYFDPLCTDISRLTPRTVAVTSRNIVIAEDYELLLEERAAAFDQIEAFVSELAEMNVDTIVQNGVNFAHCRGNSFEELRAYIDRIRDAYGVSFQMAGMALVDALDELGINRVSVNNGYYRPEWKHGINRFLEQAGVEISTAARFVELGISPDQEELEKTGWVFPKEVAVESMRRAAAADPDCEAVVFTSVPHWSDPASPKTPLRLFMFVEEIEKEIGKPIVSSEAALLYYTFKSIGVSFPKGHGTLLDRIA